YRRRPARRRGAVLALLAPALLRPGVRGVRSYQHGGGPHRRAAQTDETVRAGERILSLADRPQRRPCLNTTRHCGAHAAVPLSTRRREKFRAAFFAFVSR